MNRHAIWYVLPVKVASLRRYDMAVLRVNNNARARHSISTRHYYFWQPFKTPRYDSAVATIFIPETYAFSLGEISRIRPVPPV